MKTQLLKIFIAFTIVSCTGKTNKGQINNSKVDLESNSYGDSSTYQFELVKASNDTFKLVSNDLYFYYCFGKFVNPNELIAKYASQAQILKEPTYVYNDSTQIDTLYRVLFQDGFIKYIFDEDEQEMHLVSARIFTNKFGMTNGIKVGLNRMTFNKILFGINVPPTIEKYNNIQIETALIGVWVTFRFRNNVLKTITLDTDYQVEKR